MYIKNVWRSSVHGNSTMATYTTYGRPNKIVERSIAASTNAADLLTMNLGSRDNVTPLSDTSTAFRFTCILNNHICKVLTPYIVPCSPIMPIKLCSTSVMCHLLPPSTTVYIYFDCCFCLLIHLLFCSPCPN